MVKTFPIYLFRIFFLRKNMFLKRKTRLIKGKRSKFPSVSLPVDDGKTTEKKERNLPRVCSSIFMAEIYGCGKASFAIISPPHFPKLFADMWIVQLLEGKAFVFLPLQARLTGRGENTKKPNDGGNKKCSLMHHKRRCWVRWKINQASIGVQRDNTEASGWVNMRGREGLNRLRFQKLYSTQQHLMEIYFY